jgi:hypothetical protein
VQKGFNEISTAKVDFALCKHGFKTMITHFVPGGSGQKAVHHSWNVLLVTLTLPTIFQYLSSAST